MSKLMPTRVTKPNRNLAHNLTNTGPCGTPALIDNQLEDWPFKTTL